jgi:hypothetical protein
VVALQSYMHFAPDDPTSPGSKFLRQKTDRMKKTPHWDESTVEVCLTVVFVLDIINQLAWAAFLGIKYRKSIFPSFKFLLPAVANSPKNLPKVPSEAVWHHTLPFPRGRGRPRGRLWPPALPGPAQGRLLSSHLCWCFLFCIVIGDTTV